MMTPRSLTMGNKVYKLHVKYGSAKESLSLSPEASIHQLKQMIHQTFAVSPEEQMLLCNGKPLDLSEDNITLKQARIPNGSKILLQKCGVHRSDSLDSADDATQPHTRGADSTSPIYTRDSGNLHKGQHSHPDDKGGDEPPPPGLTQIDRQMATLSGIESRGLELEQYVRKLGCDIDDLKNKSVDVRLSECRRLKKECGIRGELLMKNLEELDQLSFGEGMCEARAGRKRVATLLNRVLDVNDANTQTLADILKQS